MLMGLFMQFQDQDGEQGLSRDELETLVDMLPEGSGNKVRAHLGDFSEMDADGDGVVSMANFRDFVRRVGEDLDNTSQTGGLLAVGNWPLESDPEFWLLLAKAGVCHSGQGSH